MTITHADIETYIRELRTESREAFIAFMQERKALTDSLGHDAAEAELLTKYSSEITDAKAKL